MAHFAAVASAPFDGRVAVGPHIDGIVMVPRVPRYSAGSNASISLHKPLPTER